MHFLDLLTPWIAFAAILFPLLYLERWIHRHLYGVGWLLTQDKERATILYYLILLPGVFLHEFSQWLTAGALGVQTRRIRVWPKPQSDGTLRLDFVQLRKASLFRATIIGTVPFIIGIAVVWIISQNIFDVQSLSDALSTGTLPVIQAELNRLFSTPDFWLWLYLLFAIGNAMMPTPNDRQNWPIVFGIFGVIAALLLILGLGEEVLIPTLQGPIARALGVLVTAFGTVLVLDCFVVLILGLLERALERITGTQVKYDQARHAPLPKPEPGGEAPLPPEQAPKRITERRLPVPPAPAQPQIGPISTSSFSRPGEPPRIAYTSPGTALYSSDEEKGPAAAPTAKLRPGLPTRDRDEARYLTGPRQREPADDELDTQDELNDDDLEEELIDDELNNEEEKALEDSDDDELRYEPLEDTP